MKYKLKDLLSYDIKTLDAQDGTIKDFLFDSKSWTIQYIEADFGGFFSSNRILIPRSLFRVSQVGKNELYIAITKTDIDNCPKPEEHKPISRKYEEELNSYYHVDYYWAMPPLGITGSTLPYQRENAPYVAAERKEGTDEENTGTNLRSYNEIKGYDIKSTDGNLGEIDDLVIHDDSWRVAYIIMDTSKWVPWSKKVLLETEVISNINYQYSEIHINLHSDAVKDAPEYDSAVPIDDQYENNIHQYYEKILKNHVI